VGLTDVEFTNPITEELFEQEEGEFNIQPNRAAKNDEEASEKILSESLAVDIHREDVFERRKGEQLMIGTTTSTMTFSS
jgi:hypothetical protein